MAQTRNGYVAAVRPNSEGWLDKLPLIVELKPRSLADEIGIGAPMKYTVDANGRVWPNGSEDPFDIVQF